MISPINQLHLLSENEDFAVGKTAKKALQYLAEFDSGNLSAEEYKDLMLGLQNSKDIAQLAGELDSKQLLASAIGSAISLVV